MCGTWRNNSARLKHPAARSLQKEVPSTRRENLRVEDCVGRDPQRRMCRNLRTQRLERQVGRMSEQDPVGETIGVGTKMLKHKHREAETEGSEDWRNKSSGIPRTIELRRGWDLMSMHAKRRAQRAARFLGAKGLELPAEGRCPQDIALVRCERNLQLEHWREQMCFCYAKTNYFSAIGLHRSPRCLVRGG